MGISNYINIASIYINIKSNYINIARVCLYVYVCVCIAQQLQVQFDSPFFLYYYYFTIVFIIIPNIIFLIVFCFKGFALISTSAPLQTFWNNDTYVDSAFADISAGRARSVYRMNSTARFDQLPTHLAGVPLNIRDGVHLRLGRSFGINIPTYYLAGRLTFSELHLEDGCLDSCNLLPWGE